MEYNKKYYFEKKVGNRWYKVNFDNQFKLIDYENAISFK